MSGAPVTGSTGSVVVPPRAALSRRLVASDQPAAPSAHPNPHALRRNSSSPPSPSKRSRIDRLFHCPAFAVGFTAYFTVGKRDLNSVIFDAG